MGENSMVNYKTGYKIFQINLDYPTKKPTLRSAFSNGRITKYHNYKRTYQKLGCGPLAVFTDYLSAMKFFTAFTSLQKLLIRVKYKPSKDKTLWKSFEHNRLGSLVKRECLCKIPKGTDYAKWVKVRW